MQGQSVTTQRAEEPHENHGRILVVDDEPLNRELLRDLLVARGHEVVEAEDGVNAITKAGSVDCDAILLDVMMPRMDGLEACRQLKANPETAHIPVLMVTALVEREQRLQGIAAGANDYLTKPIDRQDVILRVHNAVAAKRLYDRVEAELLRVRELEALRDNLTRFIMHDMRAPLMSMMGGLQIMMDGFQGSGDDKQFLAMALGATQELTEMVSSLLDVSRMESRQMPLHVETCDVATLAKDAIRRIEPLTTFREVRMRAFGDSAPARVDKGLIGRVFTNLLVNAIKFSPVGSEIAVKVSRENADIRAEVSDAGPGIPPEHHDRIFEKFGQVEYRRENRKHSTGLGLAFCKLAVEAHGGRIGVESPSTPFPPSPEGTAEASMAAEAGKGSTFWFTIPARG